MQLMVTGRHVNVTEPMKQYARDKLSRIMRGRPRLNELHVVMDVEKYRHRVEITARGKNLELFCQEETPDMYASIDGALAKLERQLRRYRERHSRKHHQHSEAPPATPGEEESSDKGEPYISSHLAMKIMYLDEALLQMKTEKHLFFVFLNAETKAVNLLYRTSDSEVLLLAPRKIKAPGRRVKYYLKGFREESISPDSTPRPLKKGSRYVEWATPEEALASMVPVGERFRFFLSTTVQNACVVYQRGDGSYVLIEPRE